MIALAFLLAVAGAPPPCTDVLDRTPGCTAPDELAPPIAADAKRVEAPRWDVGTLPAELTFVSVGLAAGGAAALVLGLATTPNNEDERFAQEVAAFAGAGLLVWSGLVGAGAAAFAVFDPTSGALRLDVFPAKE